MTKLLASDHLYEKISTLQHIIMATVNRAPFSPFQHMPEVERQVAISDLLDEQGKELLNVENRSVNYLN
jgi:hypothetical protein